MAMTLPANAEDVRKIVEERLEALSDHSGVLETVSVEWRGDQLSLNVISMPLDLLSYNPDTHRIRAQRSLDPARDRALKEDPFGPAGQAYLRDLLMGDPADPTKTDASFEALKDDLREHGQSDPGIITRSGVLINGNTRRAALRELGQQNIRVGVLPSDAGFEDLQSIELSLQLRKDHKRDYSFMNFLLAVDERVKAGWPSAKIQSDFRIKASTLERSRWILSEVDGLIERSKVAGAGDQHLSMRLVDFETHQGKLEELYRAYTSLKAKSPEEAEALREQRLLAIALDKSKTDVRLIESDFAERYMPSVIPTEGVPAAAAARIPGTTITAPAPSEKIQALRALTTRVVQAKATMLAASEATPESVTKAGASLKEVDDAIETALVQAGKTGRLIKKRFAPADRLSDANDNLQLSLSAVADARATGNFDPDDLDEVLLNLKNNVIKLAQLVSRDHENTEAEGLLWLRAVATLPDTSES